MCDFVVHILKYGLRSYLLDLKHCLSDYYIVFHLHFVTGNKSFYNRCWRSVYLSFGTLQMSTADENKYSFILPNNKIYLYVHKTSLQT